MINVSILGIQHKILYYASFFALIVTPFFTYIVKVHPALQTALYSSSIIYVGAHLSLEQRSIDPVTGKKKIIAETVSARDAYTYPLYGSATLLSLYLAFKFLSVYWVNLLLLLGLTTVGCFCLGELFAIFTNKIVWSNKIYSLDMRPIIDSYVSSKLNFVICKLFKVDLTKTDSTLFNPTLGHIIAHVIAFGFGIAWLATEQWILHNIFAFAVSITVIRYMSVSSFKIACILLIGLFLYDIFWVFGTNVMVTVAVAFKAPAKLILPLSHNPWKASLLGVGDIALPGIFIATTLRFDHHLHEEALRQQSITPATTVNIHQDFKKLYFWCNMLAYEVGLMISYVFLIISKRAQPALLYLVPAVLIGLFLPAYLHGQLDQVNLYVEEKADAKEPPDTKNAVAKDDNVVGETLLYESSQPIQNTTKLKSS